MSMCIECGRRRLQYVCDSRSLLRLTHKKYSSEIEKKREIDRKEISKTTKEPRTY